MHACVEQCGGERCANKEEVRHKQQRCLVWFLTSFHTAKRGPIRISLHSPDTCATHILPPLQPFDAFILIMPQRSESQSAL